MVCRLACVALLLASACGAPAKPNDASNAGHGGVPLFTLERPRFAWKAPFTVHVSEDATKDKNNASVSYWLDVCAKAPDQLVISHRDFHFVSLNGKPANSPELAPTLAQLAPLMSAMPRFTVDAHGKPLSLEGIPELIARLRAASPNADLDELAKTLSDPAVVQATFTAANERWNTWVHAWLSVDPRSIAAQDIVGPHRVRLSQAAHAKGIPDPSGSGATIDIDAELATDTEWPEIRPWTASSNKKVRVTLNGESVTKTETHRYRFDWNAVAAPLPDCAH